MRRDESDVVLTVTVRTCPKCGLDPVVREIARFEFIEQPEDNGIYACVECPTHGSRIERLETGQELAILDAGSPGLRTLICERVGRDL